MKILKIVKKFATTAYHNEMDGCVQDFFYFHIWNIAKFG
jgi:hypothetical protein